MGSYETAPQERSLDGYSRRWLLHQIARCEVAASLVLLLIVIITAFSRPDAIIHPPSSNLTHRSACTDYPDECRSIAPFIFDTIYSLLKQWPNTFASNGHTAVAGTILPNTILYHARPDGSQRRAPTFYAFDVEMSLGIYGGTGTPRLYTMVTTQPLHILYLDGASATLTGWGTLDSQMALLQKEVLLNPDEGAIYDENHRAIELCTLAKDLNIDGFVRMNAGFEAIICNSSRSRLTEASVLDITVPGNQENEKDSSLPRDPNRIPPHGFGNVFAPQNSWEWLRSATWHYGIPGTGMGTGAETRVQLDYCGIASFYDPYLQSLHRKHHGGNEAYQNGWGLRRGHRLVSISENDRSTMRSWLRDITHAQRSSKKLCSRVNWQALVETITNQHRTRSREILMAMRLTVEDEDSILVTIQKIHELSHAVLYPCIEYPARTTNEPFTAKDAAISRCTTTHTQHVAPQNLNDFEYLIKQSIEIIMHELCSWTWSVFEWSDKHTSNVFDPRDMISKPAYNSGIFNAQFREVRQASQDLINWIGWDDWVDCERKCAWNELCTIPTWPVIFAPGKHQGGYFADNSYTAEEMAEFWRPKCLNRTEWDKWGGRAREPAQQLPDAPGDGL